MKRERTPERKVDRENRKRFSWWRLKKVSVKDRSGSARGKYSEGERERRGGNSWGSICKGGASNVLRLPGNVMKEISRAFKNVPVQRDKKPKRRNGNINKEAAVRFEHVETGKTWKEAKLHEPQRQIYWKKAGEANGYWTSAAEDPWCVAPRIPEVDWIFAHECFKLYESAGSQKRVPKGFRGTAKISRSKLTYRIIHGLYKVYGRV